MKECILILIIFTAFFLNGNHTLAESSPNILFIIGDDIGVDALEMYGIGSDFPQTPTLENLRSDGLMFTNVWASPVCSATRASLLTGMFGKDNGVNSVPGVLKPLNTTIFEAINQKTQNKYASCVVGKWHVSKTSNTDHPITQGATEFMGVMEAGVEDYYNWAKVEDGTLNECNIYATSYLTDFAINWINKQSNHGLCGWLIYHRILLFMFLPIVYLAVNQLTQ